MKTDNELLCDVIAELAWEPSVNAGHIGVEVRDGNVKLAGQVGSYAEGWIAERAARRVPGVASLDNSMDISARVDGKRNDGEIARSAGKALQWVGSLAGQGIRVRVESGWITLSGTVEREGQRQAAARAIRFLTGVTGATNRITVNPAGDLPRPAGWRYSEEDVADANGIRMAVR